MSNEEKLKAMSRWELAKFIFDVSSGSTQFTVCERMCADCEYSEEWRVSEIGEWLMQEAKND